MDDFYNACKEKLEKASDPTTTIGELMAISVQDVSKTQLSQFAEQTTTLLSLYFQSVARPSQETLDKFRDLRQQLERALDGMEQIMEAEIQFPPPPQQSSDEQPWW